MIPTVTRSATGTQQLLGPIADAIVDWRLLTDEQLLGDPGIAAAWGVALAVDLVGCDPVAIRDGEGIARFAVELCERIGMRRFGPATVVRFGADPRVCGYSLVQLIETSLVSGHFAEQSDSAFIDIFSCKPYPPHAVVDLCRDRFGGEVVRATLTLRGPGHPMGRSTW